MKDDNYKKRHTQFNMKNAEALFISQAPKSLPTILQEPLQVPPEKKAARPQKKLDTPPVDNVKKRTKTILTGPPRALRLPPIAEAGGLSLLIEDRSPWDLYRTYFECELAGTVYICESRREASDLVAVRSYKSSDGELMLKKYRQLRHVNVLTAMECFRYQEIYYFVVEDLPISLEHVVASDAFPTESQLGCILRQILAGMGSLLEGGYQVPFLECSGILMGLNGMIKIALLELALPYKLGQSQTPSVKRIGYLAMELMQKYVKENIGIDNTERWPIDSKAVEFLLLTISAGAIADLNKHPLIEMASPQESLTPLARLAMISACTFYSFKGWK